MPDLGAKLNIIKDLLADHRVLVALSGGVDSSVMARLALDFLGYDRVGAATAISETMAASELEAACKLAETIGVKHVTIPISCLDNPEFTVNSADRCYYCKHSLYSELIDYAHKHGYTLVVEGTNASDQGDYRPGIRALKEMGIASPFLISGISKEEIRQLAKQYGLFNWDRPSNACLASRFPYGNPITSSGLKQVETGEEILHTFGFTNCRLRHYGDTARIEISPEQFHLTIDPAIRLELVKNLKALGYSYITIDLEGYRTGSLNEVLPQAAT
ncbi:MAG: ATP-dependent sacrificial sulfur transferase LarE [Methylocystaceae bacterium]